MLGMGRSDGRIGADMTEHGVQNAKPAAHGGDLESYRERYGHEPIDYSINVNPFGLSPLARKAIACALDEADRYPDTECRALRRALAQRHGVMPAHVICGNGAADLIERFVRALRPKRALVCAPTFSEYERALRKVGCAVDHFMLDPARGFRLDERIIHAIDARLDVVVLCEPNNPTGVVSPRPLLQQVLARCESCECTLMVDECFNGFLDDPAAFTLRPLVADHERLFILDSFTKTYGMAGVRLGFGLCSNESLLQSMAEQGQQWNVSHLAQVGGRAALEDVAHLQRMHDCVSVERPRMKAALEQLPLQVFPSDANYLLIRCAVDEGDGAGHFAEALARKGFLIRDCSNFPSLESGYYRIAVRRPSENDRLLQAIEEVLRGCAGPASTEPSTNRSAG